MRHDKLERAVREAIAAAVRGGRTPDQVLTWAEQETTGWRRYLDAVDEYITGVEHQTPEPPGQQHN